MRVMGIRRKTGLLVIVLSFLFVYYNYMKNDHLLRGNSNHQKSVSNVKNPNYQDATSTERWAVLALSASQPTAAVQSLLNHLSADWCVIVVGDEYSPDELSVNRSCYIYLPMNKQASLGFEIVHRTPINSTSRKNIGYLYAIMNGATVILDLDSDSIPIPLEGTHLPIEEQRATFNRPGLNEDREIPMNSIHKDPTTLDSESVVWNPYQSDTVYPRGFPTDCKQSSINNIHRSRVMTKTCYPIVQQLLLTDTTSKDIRNKVVLPHAVFAPYDSRSTVHLYEAFWSLMLPKTVKGLESDVWRSYIAQSLLYLIPDACVMFTSSAVYHQHNHLTNRHDTISENPITCEFLNSLKYLPLRFDTFEDALSLPYEQLNGIGILEVEDVEYLGAWIRDLKKAGYSFPKLPDKSQLWTKNIQLCIMYNHVPLEYYVRVLMAYYLRFFDNIMLLFDGEWPEKPSFIPEYVKFSECRSNHGHFQHKCLHACLANSGKGVEGYLYVADDMFVNLSKMRTLPRSKLWFIDMKWVYNYTQFDEDAFTNRRWTWWNTYLEKTKMVVDNLPPEWKEVLVKFVGFPNQFHGHSISDIVYVPQHLASNMVDVLSYIINTTDLFCEIAIPLAVDIVDPQYAHMVWGYVEGRRKNDTAFIMSTATKAHFVHPLKLAIRPTADIWRELMAKQLKLLAT